MRSPNRLSRLFLAFVFCSLYSEPERPQKTAKWGVSCCRSWATCFVSLPMNDIYPVVTCVGGNFSKGTLTATCTVTLRSSQLISSSPGSWITVAL